MFSYQRNSNKRLCRIWVWRSTWSRRATAVWTRCWRGSRWRASWRCRGGRRARWPPRTTPRRRRRGRRWHWRWSPCWTGWGGRRRTRPHPAWILKFVHKNWVNLKPNFRKKSSVAVKDHQKTTSWNYQLQQEKLN